MVHGDTRAAALDAVRDAAAQTGAGLRELTHAGPTLEDALIGAIGVSSPDARVIDVRFDRYRGKRSGRAEAVWSLARWSAMRALGARRGWKAKVIPIALILVAFAPALVVLGLRALFPGSISGNIESALPFSDYQDTIAIVDPRVRGR